MRAGEPDRALPRVTREWGRNHERSRTFHEATRKTIRELSCSFVVFVPISRGPDLERARVEGIALADIPRLEPLPEPAGALRRRAMRERVRHDVALSLALQLVVSHRGRRVERFLDVDRK